MKYAQYSEFKEMTLEELKLERDDISFCLVEANEEDLEGLELKLEEIEEVITLKEADIDELEF